MIRASPHAWQEQPFAPAQLGREEALLGNTGAVQSEVNVGTFGEDEVYDDTATVRVQHERRLLNKWWKEQMGRHDKQRLCMYSLGKNVVVPCRVIPIIQNWCLPTTAKWHKIIALVVLCLYDGCVISYSLVGSIVWMVILGSPPN